MPPEWHACAAEWCGALCARGYFMCLRHWRMVPLALRHELRIAWGSFRRLRAAADREGRKRRVEAVRAAQARAVAAVREKELKKFAVREAAQSGLGF